MVESNMKFGSLQQHYKLLKNQHDDLVEECANNKTKSTKEYSGLKEKLKRVTIEFNDELRKKDMEIESVKVCVDAFMSILSMRDRHIDVFDERKFLFFWFRFTAPTETTAKRQRNIDDGTAGEPCHG